MRMVSFRSFAIRIVLLLAFAGCSPGFVGDVEGGGGQPGGADGDTDGAGLKGGAAGNAGVGSATQLGGSDVPPVGGSTDNTAGRGGSAGAGLGAGDMAGSPVIGAPCPTAPPFDETDLDIVTRCTRPMVAAVGNGLRRAFSYDGQTWFGDVWFPSGGDENENSHPQGGVHTSTNGGDWKSWQECDTLPGGLRASFGAQDGATDGKQALFISGSSYRIWDGKMWSQGTIPGRGIDRVTFGNGRFAGVRRLRTATCRSRRPR